MNDEVVDFEKENFKIDLSKKEQMYFRVLFRVNVVTKNIETKAHLNDGNSFRDGVKVNVNFIKNGAMKENNL